MCGRYAFFASANEVAQRFQVPEPTLFEPRYNIAPDATCRRRASHCCGSHVGISPLGIDSLVVNRSGYR